MKSTFKLKEQVMDLRLHQRMTFRQIAVQLGISIDVVRYLVNQPAGTPPLTLKSLSDEQKNMIGLDYQNGMSKTALTKKYNLKLGVANAVLKELAIKCRPAQKYNIDLELALYLHEAGYSLKDIAEIMDVSFYAMYDLLRRNKLLPGRPEMVKTEYIPSILEKYKQGETLKDLAASYGISYPTFKKFLKKYDAFPVDKSKKMKFLF